MNHDSNYKQIFSHKETVTELLQGFVHEEWVNEIDYSTLEKVNSSYVSEALIQREDDIIWRVKIKEQWLYIYLLIEFQSRNDPWMALRIMVYSGLLYQDLIKSKKITAKDRLPPIFPIVLYNGSEPWTAPQQLSDLIESYPKSLHAYRPDQRYFLLEENHIKESELKEAEGTVAEIIRLESSPEPQVVREIVGRLAKQLKNKEHDSLRRAITVWINRIVLKKMGSEESIPEMTDLQEIDNMLAERVEQWTENWKQQGLEQGLQQGEGKILVRLLEKRFGSVTDHIKEKITDATEEQLEQWADNILDAKKLDDVFQSH